jgi:hypothetical protein
LISIVCPDPVVSGTGGSDYNLISAVTLTFGGCVLVTSMCQFTASAPAESDKAISLPSFAHQEGFPLAGLIGDQLYLAGVVPGDTEYLL